MKRFFWGLSLAAMLFVGCSKEAVEDGGAGDEACIPITFTLSTPGSDGIIYPRSRAVQDASEYAIKQMTLLVYDATNAQTPTFLRKHDLTSDITLYDNGNGTYTFSLEAPISDMNAQRKFVFVVNDDASVVSVTAGSSESDLHISTEATIALSDGNTADLLADSSKGIAMSGTATGTSGEIITIVPNVKCEVKLTRIVARIDLQNNTPNMKIKSAELVGASSKGYLFAQSPLAAPADADRIKLGSNATVDITASHPAQGSGTGFTAMDFKKVFYTYERSNTTTDYAAVRVTYTVNESEGTVEIPFVQTEVGGVQTPVDIERNHLYTIVLGNGKPVETNPVEFTILDEAWNLVEMPEEIGPGDAMDAASQAALNAKLKVNMFTDYNVLSLTQETAPDGPWKVKFYDHLATSAAECPTTSYFSYQWLSGQDVDGSTSANGANVKDLRKEIFTDDAGMQYRIPTAGEQALLLPYQKWVDNTTGFQGDNNVAYHVWWNDNSTTNQHNVTLTTDPFVETIYLEDNDDFTPKTSGAVVSGVTQLKIGEKYETVSVPSGSGFEYNIYPVYGLRFKGSDQYAAYRWESLPIASNSEERYFSIKVKALHPQDNTTTIDDVANDATFWSEGYIEFKIPASGYYNEKPVEANLTDNCAWRGLEGYLKATTRQDDNFTYGLCLTLYQAHTSIHHIETVFPLRLVKVE